LEKQDELKQKAAHRAVEFIDSGMVVGLGTGSTTAFAVIRIGELLKSGDLKNIVGIPTSIRTETLAGELGMEEAAILDFGLGQLGDFLGKSVVQVTQVSSADVAPAPAGE